MVYRIKSILLRCVLGLAAVLLLLMGLSTLLTLQQSPESAQVQSTHHQRASADSASSLLTPGPSGRHVQPQTNDDTAEDTADNLENDRRPSNINRRLDDDDVHLHAKIKKPCKRLDDNDFLLDFKPLAPKDIASIETFTFFVGWQRSGHSIIGSLLDGHPDVIIAHEFYLFTNLYEYPFNRTSLFNKLFENSFCNSQSYGARSSFHREKGYNLELANSWQGRFRELKLIGDKTGGDVTNVYDNEPQSFYLYLYRLRQLVTVPLKAINVVRNPFDMIATLTLYRGSNTTDVKVKATEENKYDNPAILRKATKEILRKATALYQIERTLDLDMLRIHSEDFVRAPNEVMSRLCQFLGLQCSEEYLQQCADKTFKTVSRSRHLIKWDPAMISMINEVIHTYDFFKRYSFDGE